MLARLREILAGTRRRTNPSVVLILRRATQTSLLHIVPETGDVERVDFTPPAFTYRGTTERSREQIATISIYAAKDHTDEFLKEISTRATKILSGRENPSPEGDSVLLVEQALRSAVSESLESRSDRSPKTGDQPYTVFLVHIDRRKPGKILTDDDLTSFPRKKATTGFMSLVSIAQAGPEMTRGLDRRAAESCQVVVWPSLPDLPRLTGTTIPDCGRHFYIYTPSTILKLRTEEGEAVMTALAHIILGKVVPSVSGLVRLADPPQEQGLLLERQPGTPLVELWSTLSPTEQATLLKSLVDLLVRMRAPHPELDYYGRPNRQPYITPSDLGPSDVHTFCRTYQEWNASRVRALRNFVGESEIDEARVQELEHIKQQTVSGNLALVDLPVLTHGDLSDRNILVDPSTLQVTGLIDWELANVAPAYFEYAAARLSGGHDPPWRKVLLEVLSQVLRIECDRKVLRTDAEPDLPAPGSEDLFTQTMAAWKSLVNVERSAQGYSDGCYWTFEETV